MGHTECSPSHLSVAVVFPLVQEGLTKGQEGTSSFLSWAGPQWSLWLFGYIGLIRRLMEWREGPCGLGDSDLGPGPLQESLDLGKGRSGPPAQQFCQVEREGSSGGFGHRFPGGRRKPCCVGAVGPAAMRWGVGQGLSRSGRAKGAPQIPSSPCSVGRVCGGTSATPGPGATAPWG